MGKRREQLKGHLDLLLLAVLESGADHGYAIIASLKQRSGGEFDLPEGTVYPALHRLEREGLIRSEWESGGPRRRRVYALNAPGVAALAESRQEWERFSVGVRSVVWGMA